MSTEITLPGGAVVLVPESVTDIGDVSIHQHQAVLNTVERWRKEKFQAVQRSYAPELQEVENALWQVMISRLVDYAFGASLDMLGRVVGEARLGRADPGYRVRIRARIAINQSFGTIPDLLLVLRILNPELTPRIVEHYPAAITVDLGGTPSASGTWAEISDLLGETRAAGVALHVSIPTRARAWRFNQAGRAWGFGGSTEIGGMLTDGRRS
jgi:hypothetical protein